MKVAQCIDSHDSTAEWKEMNLGTLCTLRRELVQPSPSGNRRYVGLEHLESGLARLRHWGKEQGLLSTKNRFLPGDVLYGKLRPYLDKAVLAESDGVCSTDILVLHPILRHVHPEFLSFLLHSPAFLEYATSTTKGLHHPRTSWNDIQNFQYRIPPISEQRAIAAVLSKIQATAETQDNIVAALKELKAATMAHLFRRGLHPTGATQETAYGTIPLGWTLVPLRELALVQTGLAKGRRLNGGDVIELPYLRVANVQNGYLDLTEIKTIELRKTEVQRYLLRQGDVLLTEGGDLDKLGRGYIWSGQIPKCVHQNHIFAVRANAKRLLPGFLAYLVQSPYGRTYFLAVGHKTTNLASINSTKLKDFPVPLPSVEEQREISSSMAALDSAQAQEEAKRRSLESLFESALDSLMTGRIRLA